MKITVRLVSTALFISLMANCKNSQSTAYSPPESTEEVYQNETIYLSLQVRRTAEDYEVVNSELEVKEMQGNPNPLPTMNEAEDTFRAEVLNAEGRSIANKQISVPFNYGTPESGPEAIVRFFIPKMPEAESIKVSLMVEEGVWKEIYQSDL